MNQRVASTRAGRYVRQPTGYRAFIPAPRPPDPPVAPGEMGSEWSFSTQRSNGWSASAKNPLRPRFARSGGRQALNLNADGSYKLPPIDASGSGRVQEKQQAYLAEIIERVNGLFEGKLTDDDQLIYVNGVLKGKLLENEQLARQAASNSKEQFANSPDLKDALMHAIMDALDAHSTMSAQALASERIREGLKDILLGPGQLYESLRGEGQSAQVR